MPGCPANQAPLGRHPWGPADGDRRHGLRAVDGPGVANVLSALAGEALPAYQGGGLSKVVIEVMAAMARTSGLAPLLAPVSPNHKHLYPLTPIERYVAWQRSDGLPFDPWLKGTPINVRAWLASSHTTQSR